MIFVLGWLLLSDSAKAEVSSLVVRVQAKHMNYERRPRRRKVSRRLTINASSSVFCRQTISAFEI